MHGDGPLLVAAGAGTGKTWTIACRVARLLESGVAADRILLLTFTRRAAREMLARAQRLTGRASAGRVWGGTFHAIANRLLRRFGAPIGVVPDFTVLDQTDAADLMSLIRSDLGLAERTRRFPRKDTLAAIYSRMVNAGVPLGRVLAETFPWCADEAEGIASVFRAYTDGKRSQNVLDFDDLLLFWRVLASSPATAPRVAGSFEHILVDEYQDTNDLQAQILMAMRRENPNVTVVGDDDQAIYRFPRRDGSQHPRVPAGVPRGSRGHAGAELPIGPGGARRGERRHLARGRAPSEDAAIGAGSGTAARARDVPGRGGAIRCGVPKRPRAP